MLLSPLHVSLVGSQYLYLITIQNQLHVVKLTKISVLPTLCFSGVFSFSFVFAALDAVGFDEQHAPEAYC